MTMPPARQYDLISAAPSRHRHRQHPSTTAGTTEADKARASRTPLFHQRENNGRPVGRRRVGGYAAHAFKTNSLRGRRRYVERVGGKTRPPYVHASPLDQKKTTAWAVVSNPAARMRPSGTVLPRNDNSLENRTAVRSPASAVRDRLTSMSTHPLQRRPPFYYSRTSSGFKNKMLSAIWGRRCGTPP